MESGLTSKKLLTIWWQLLLLDLEESGYSAAPPPPPPQRVWQQSRDCNLRSEFWHQKSGESALSKLASLSSLSRASQKIKTITSGNYIALIYYHSEILIQSDS